MSKTKQNDCEQMWIESRDRVRLEMLANLEHRRARQQLTAIIDEACLARGLDPATLKQMRATKQKR